MATRSTPSELQPFPPNYTTAVGAFRNVGRYKLINSNVATRRPVGANMSTAPLPNSGSRQYSYVPRLNG